MKDLIHQPSAGDWRQGAAAVAVLSFDVDPEAPILAEGDHYAEDLSTMSHQAYGPRVGVPRILKLLAEHEVDATFFIPGVTAERWPGTVIFEPWFHYDLPLGNLKWGKGKEEIATC